MTADRQGGEAVEVEAVARELAAPYGDRSNWQPHRERAAKIIAALDAVRSSGSAAQNHEETMGHDQADAEFWRDIERERRSPQDEDHEVVSRLYLLLALFDRRDGSELGYLVRAAREGYEREVDESDAWEEFDARWNRYSSSERLQLRFTPSPERDTRAETVAEIVAWLLEEAKRPITAVDDAELIGMARDSMRVIARRIDLKFGPAKHKSPRRARMAER